MEAKQPASSDEWIVSSASQPGIAYRTDGITCGCEAAILGGDPVCLHRAAYWYTQGVLELKDGDGPEDSPPAPAAVSCSSCNGCGVQWYRGGYMLPCAKCGGAGVAPLVAQATALVAVGTGREEAAAPWQEAVSAAHISDVTERAALATAA